MANATQAILAGASRGGPNMNSALRDIGRATRTLNMSITGLQKGIQEMVQGEKDAATGAAMDQLLRVQDEAGLQELLTLVGDKWTEAGADYTKIADMVSAQRELWSERDNLATRFQNNLTAQTQGEKAATRLEELKQQNRLALEEEKARLNPTSTSTKVPDASGSLLGQIARAETVADLDSIYGTGNFGPGIDQQKVADAYAKRRVALTPEAVVEEVDPLVAARRTATGTRTSGSLIDSWQNIWLMEEAIGQLSTDDLEGLSDFIEQYTIQAQKGDTDNPWFTSAKRYAGLNENQRKMIEAIEGAAGSNRIVVSGAAITEPEMARVFKQVLPQVGDSNERIQQRGQHLINQTVAYGKEYGVDENYAKRAIFGDDVQLSPAGFRKLKYSSPSIIPKAIPTAPAPIIPQQQQQVQPVQAVQPVAPNADDELLNSVYGG